MIPQLSSAYGIMPGVLPTQSPVQTAPLSSSLPATGYAGLSQPSFDAQGGSLMGVLGSLLQLITMLMPQLGGGSQSGLTAEQSEPAYDRSSMIPFIAGNTDIPNTTRSLNQSARLDDTLAKLAQDPEGSKLLAEAKAKGYTIEVGDPSQALGGSLDKGNLNCSHCRAALDAGQQINGVTMPGEKKIVINPNAPDFEKTVVHELVHAASDGDDNSQQEEGIADVIGYRVASRITGKTAPGSAQSIYFNKMTNYQELKQSNSIRSTLASLGIDAGI